jgi:glucosamine--fructose-6-phosphate aminotransferase (isomerizing)
MCGIIGYSGPRPVVDLLIQGLKRLEYRGYDSTGIAYLDGNKIKVIKSEGKLLNTERLVGEAENTHSSTTGIGHTRWATHGKPTTQNAHPHRTGHVVLVHNGIIENYQLIRERVIKNGLKPQSETDSELFGFLVLEQMDQGKGLREAVRLAFLQIEGACSVVVMSEREPGVIIGVRRGAPLVAARDPKSGFLLASDPAPLLEYTQDVLFLEDGDLVEGSARGVEFFEIETGRPCTRAVTRLDWSADKMDRQGYPHYMLKEIHEQPLALIDTLNGVLDRKRADPFPLADQPGVKILHEARHLVFVACGTSWHAAMEGKYWIERFARISVSVELASEFRYRDPVILDGSVVVGLSQSGETADTLAVIKEMKRKGIPTLAITNVRGSTLAREASAAFYTSAGPEIGVAATKSFTSQLLMLLMWAGSLGLRQGGDASRQIGQVFDQLLKVPHALEAALARDSEFVQSCHKVARSIAPYRGFFFMGRGYSFPIALEGALKLKEIAYVHAEGYAAGELKHGPIAMIDDQMVVVVLAPPDRWREKMISNLQEMKARSARILGVGAASDRGLQEHCDWFIPMPALGEVDESLVPFALSPVVQLVSYEIAVLKEANIDQPRNLAKSVTVE